MKILEIKLRNLNSLCGQWRVDFCDPAYTSDGIFSVTGPTGAGKTTIFDAVCLALYGRTPRLNNKPKKEGVGEIMSKHTENCMANVKFEAEGKIYVCEWSMTRKKDKDGAVKFETEHTIIKDGLMIQKGVTEEVVKITGLDFKRFTQAALLAQGEFDAFIKGTDTERAKILELLTGTGIYSEISRKIVEHTTAEKNKLDEIKIERDAKIHNDNFSSYEEILQVLAQTRGQISQIEREHSDIASILAQLRVIQKLEGELEQNQEDILRLERMIAASHDIRARLEVGIRARDIQHEYSVLTQLRTQHSEKEARINRQKQQLEDDRSRLAGTEDRLRSIEAELERMTAGLPEGETPDSICTQIKLRVETFIEAYRKKTKVLSEKGNAEKEHAQAQAALDSAKKNEESARINYEHAREVLSRLMNARVSAILEAERKKLKPGVPCPVCGSVEHPAIVHGSQERGISDGEILQADGDLKAARDRENQALRILQQAGQNLSDARNHESTSHNMLEQYTKQMSECEEESMQARSSVCEMIGSIGIHNPKSCDEIISRADEWKSKADNLSSRITEMKQEIISLRGRINANSQTLNEEIASLSAMKGELESCGEKFTASLAAKNFASEKHFTDSILTEQKMTELQNNVQNHDDEMKRLQTLREDKKKRLEEEKSKAVTGMTLEEAEQLFSRKDSEIKALQVNLGRLESAQEARKKLQSEYDRLDAEYKSQEKIYNQWQAFNDRLEAKKNGGIFGKFAQRITLRMLVQLSNVQLENMNSRYTLILTPGDNELGLSVRDSEQAGEIRPTSNLSGGEKFIISLALALGLSQISGSKAQVDSLFIDEGFGSLDEDSLNSALEALSKIRRDGRMIGIISHISGISERIPAKINVIRKSEGTSIIEGPGCSGLNRL